MRRRGGDSPALVGTPREIFDYLATAVVDGLPDELQAFAMHTSELFVLTPDRTRIRSAVPTRQPQESDRCFHVRRRIRCLFFVRRNSK
jgi:hypothetical protein